ncbi:unnamed protein product [Linum tenue]|uniref:DELLA protein RGL1 n=1 Tax=Linum tenue TaxID=586396 RepID=A0AAV0S278_9ROSI|nr:unnamed protein product [Linum tenue]
MENHDFEVSDSGICGGAPITHDEFIPFPLSHTFHHVDASHLPLAADADQVEGLCILESDPLAHLSYQQNDIILYQRVAQIASSFQSGAIEDPPQSMLPVGAALSVEDLVRIAASQFVGSHSNHHDVMMSSGAFHDVTLSEEESESVELTRILLEAAENAADRQFDTAGALLQRCHVRSSPAGNPIQRLVFYYSRALTDRIDRETGRTASSRDVAREQSSDLYKAVMTPSIQLAEFHRRIPFSQVAQFAGIQAIVEHLEGSRCIHVVDLAIKNGQQWTILMQALASRPTRRRVQRLKITAVSTVGEQRIEQMGNGLVGFAEGLGLPCVFESVVVPDLAQLSRAHVRIESGQSVAVMAEYVFNTLAEPLDRLDSLIRAVRSLKPCVVVVGEVEGNMNSPVFVNRFVESLFYASAFFDCMEDCMGRDEPTRKYGEATLFGESSKIVSAIDGRERIVRSMKVDVWRTYFRRMGMVEEEMSPLSLYQANLVARKVPCWKPCTVKMNGKGLMVGWKGTKINSVTAWSFT